MMRKYQVRFGGGTAQKYPGTQGNSVASLPYYT